MIIDIGTGVDESVVMWKYNDKDKWQKADIDELIDAYESINEWAELVNKLVMKDEAPTIEPIEDTKSCGVSADKSADQNVADVPSGDITETKFYDTNGEVYATITRPSGDLISREELLKKLDRQIEWEEANAIPYEDADGGCILGLKKARKYVKLASSTEKPNANDCDLISRADAIKAVASITMSIHLSDVICDKLLALPSADAEQKWNCTASFVAEQLDRLRKMTDEEKWEFFRKFFGMGDAVQGEWINIDNYYRLATCSQCHKVTMFEKWGEYTKPYNFCPNCGARMKGGAE